MKFNNRLLFFLVMLTSLLFLFGCAEIKTASVSTSTKSNPSLERLEQKLNLSSEQETKKENFDRCEPDIIEVEVFQVLDETKALAWSCKDSTSVCSGTVVVVMSNGEALWDNKRIKTPKDKCIVVNDTYKYTTKNGVQKTVPVISFVYKYPPSNEQEYKDRILESINPLRIKCKGLDKEKKINLCLCYTDSMEKILMDSDNIKNYKDNSEKLANMLKVNTEKNCGKLPKNYEKWFK